VSLSVTSPISPSGLPIPQSANPLSNPPSHPGSRALSPAPTPTSQGAAPEVTQKDFSFLQDPAIYHPLPTTATLPAFANSQHAPTSSTPLPVLLSKGHYRQAAIVAANNLLAAPPTAGPAILALLHTRLACLCLLQEHGLAAAEAKALGDLNSSFYRHVITGAHVVLWGLRVLVVRLQALGWGDGRRGVLAYYELGREARDEIKRIAEKKRKQSAADDDSFAKDEQLWRTRLREIGVCVANTLVEMGDLEAAASHLASLRNRANSSSDPDEDERLAAMEALVWLRVGDIAAAERCIKSVQKELPSADSPGSTESSDTSSSSNLTGSLAPLQPLIALANNTLPAAISSLATLTSANPTDPLYSVNYAVARFCSGQLGSALETITAMASGEKISDLEADGTNASEPTPPFRALLFNAATLLDLCCEKSRDRKLALAEKIAARDPRPECGGWERGLAGELKV
jgi:trafficking protein particle complex subunit 12